MVSSTSKFELVDVTSHVRSAIVLGETLVNP